MYLPAYHEEHDQQKLLQHIHDYPFGSWACLTQAGLVMNHLPFLLCTESGKPGVLRTHVARANPVWRNMQAEMASIVSFLGPQAYISPAWYPSKVETGNVVPTWNYISVQVSGPAQVIQDKDWLLNLLRSLTLKQENQRWQTREPSRAWQLEHAAPEFIERLLTAIVGIEIPITQLQGRWKLSQDETPADQQGTIAGLAEAAQPNDVELAQKMRQHFR